MLTDAGRLLRPLLIVDDNKLNIQKKILFQHHNYNYYLITPNNFKYNLINSNKYKLEGDSIASITLITLIF